LATQTGEPGWLAGQINGHTGWFPESYAEKCEDNEVASSVAVEETHVWRKKIIKVQNNQFLHISELKLLWKRLMI
jgi:hypothetical protein